MIKEKPYKVTFNNSKSVKLFAKNENEAKFIAIMKVDRDTFWSSSRIEEVKELDYLHWRYRTI